MGVRQYKNDESLKSKENEPQTEVSWATPWGKATMKKVADLNETESYDTTKSFYKDYDDTGLETCILTGIFADSGTYVHSHGFDHIMMAMETEITKDGVHYKELKGTPEEEAKLKESYAHLCKLRDEVIGMGVLPAIKDWKSINPNID